MSKSKNHTNHNQNKKNHKNGIKKPQSHRHKPMMGVSACSLVTVQNYFEYNSPSQRSACDAYRIASKQLGNNVGFCVCFVISVLLLALRQPCPCLSCLSWCSPLFRTSSSSLFPSNHGAALIGRRRASLSRRACSVRARLVRIYRSLNERYLPAYYVERIAESTLVTSPVNPMTCSFGAVACRWTPSSCATRGTPRSITLKKSSKMRRWRRHLSFRMTQGRCVGLFRNSS